MDEEQARLAGIRRWSSIAHTPEVISGLDAVFFDSSATKSFASEEARREFRHRWLGRYLEHDPACAYVAFDDQGQVVGYLVGSLGDPAQDPRFSDIAYFKDFAALTARFPAQLHVNLAPESRGQGLGAALVGQFCRDAAAAGAPGIHAVTARGMRNVRFYEAQGFQERGAIEWNGRELLFLARDLAP